MPDQLQLRGGTTTEHNSFTGALREVTVDTTKKTLVVHDGASAGGTALMKESGGNAASTVGIGVGGANKITINADGHVDIASNLDCAAGLDVTGDITTTGNISINSNAPNLLFTDGNDNPDFGILASGGQFRIQDTTNTGNLLTLDSSKIQAVKNLDALAGLDVTGAITGTGDLTIDTNTLHVDSSNNRVGIGTTSPSSELEVVDTSGSSIIRASGTSSGSTVTAQLLGSSSGYGILGTTTNHALAVSTNNLERMRIDSSGKVHIGLTNGTGQFNVKNSNDATQNALEIYNDNGVRNAAFSQNSSGDATLDLRTNAPLQTVLIQSNGNSHFIGGNVGIGTTSPSLPLDVQGANNTTFDNLGTLGLTGTDAYNSGNAGSGIHFNGKFNSGGSITTLAQISGIKQDTGDGTFDGALTFGVRNDAEGTNIERMRIDSSGRVLVGTTTAVGGGAPLQVVHASDSGIYLGNSNTNASGIVEIEFAPSNNVTTSIIRGYAIEDASQASEMTGGLKFFIREDSNFKEAVRIDREGNLTMAEAIDLTTAKFSVAHSGNNGLAGVPTFVARFEQKTDNTGTDHACIVLKHNSAASSSEGVGVLFINSAGSEVGEINISASGVGYQSNSDYRLKENAVAISDGITRLKTLKPYRFNFINNPDRTVDGFFAHEVTAVPEAISGTKDKTKNVLYTEKDTIPDGKAVGDVKEVKPVYQGIDQSKLVPLLVAAVQELIGKVEALEAA